MGISKYLKEVLECCSVNTKKNNNEKALRKILSKLKEKKEAADSKLSNKSLDKKSKKELKNNVKILEFQIKKGEKILKELKDNSWLNYPSKTIVLEGFYFYIDILKKNIIFLAFLRLYSCYQVFNWSKNL